MNVKVAIRTKLLLVDDNIQQLEMRALALEMSGFTVVTAGSPVEAISIMAQGAGHSVLVAVLDYEMPGMNGCVLADYFRERYPDIKIILHSGASDIPESEMTSIDGFVPKGDGIDGLLEEVSIAAELHGAQIETYSRAAASPAASDSL